MRVIKMNLLALLIMGTAFVTVGQSTNTGLKITSNYDLSNADLFSELSAENMLKMQSNFTRFSTSREFKAYETK